MRREGLRFMDLHNGIKSSKIVGVEVQNIFAMTSSLEIMVSEVKFSISQSDL